MQLFFPSISNKIALRFMVKKLGGGGQNRKDLPLHSKLLFKTITRADGGTKNVLAMLGGTNKKDLFNHEDKF